MASRKIIQIDEEKCNGCGQCIPNCAEGSLKIVNGKAKLVADILCDGLGACLGHCPQDALKIVEREAEDFDELAVEKYLQEQKEEESAMAAKATPPSPACGCPSVQLSILGSADTEDRKAEDEQDSSPREGTAQGSSLVHWPVKLRLVPESAPFLRDAKLLVLADCAGVAAYDLHETLLRGKAVVILCPKFEDPGFYRAKLQRLVAASSLRSITVAHMQVPCCHGLFMAVKQAVEASGKEIPVEHIVLGRSGEKRSLRR